MAAHVLFIPLIDSLCVCTYSVYTVCLCHPASVLMCIYCTCA